MLKDQDGNIILDGYKISEEDYRKLMKSSTLNINVLNGKEKTIQFYSVPQEYIHIDYNYFSAENEKKKKVLEILKRWIEGEELIINKEEENNG